MPLKDPNIYRSNGDKPEHARKILAEVQGDELYRKAMLDRGHPLHDRFVRHTGWLHEVAAGEPAPAGSVPSRVPTFDHASGMLNDPEIRLYKAQQNPALFDRSSPAHEQAVAEVSLARQALTIHQQGSDK